MNNIRIIAMNLGNMADLVNTNMICVEDIDFDSLSYTDEAAAILLEDIRNNKPIWLKPISCVRHSYGVKYNVVSCLEILCLRIMNDFIQGRLEHIYILTEEEKSNWRTKIMFNAIFLVL